MVKAKITKEEMIKAVKISSQIEWYYWKNTQKKSNSSKKLSTA